MATLDEINASGDNGGQSVIVRTLELTCEAWAEPVLICNGFTGYTCATEDGRVLTFIAANIGITLAKKNNKGNQTLAFSADNTTGEVSRKVYASMETRKRINATYRTYLTGNLNAPAEKPWKLVLLSGSIEGVVAQLQLGYFNMIGVAWPRRLYTTNFAPALRYI